LIWSAASVDVTLNGTSGSHDGMVLQRVAGRDYVYVRDDSNGDVTVTDVSAVPPRFLGVIGGRATSGNNAIGLSADGTFLVVSNTTTDTWTRLD
jgi:hypothetical protein